MREGQGDTVDGSGEYDGPYSYIDLVKNRGLMVTNNSIDGKTSARHEREFQVTSVN